jgi:hypothetical protein
MQSVQQINANPLGAKKCQRLIKHIADLSIRAARRMAPIRFRIDTRKERGYVPLSDK